MVTNSFIRQMENEFDSKIKQLANSRTEIVNQLQKRMLSSIDDWLIIQCRKHVKPPIKGELTKGKLRWRGVQGVCEIIDSHTNKHYLLQRGNKIGDELIIKWGIEIK